MANEKEPVPPVVGARSTVMACVCPAASVRLVLPAATTRVAAFLAKAETVNVPGMMLEMVQTWETAETLPLYGPPAPVIVTSI